MPPPPLPATQNSAKPSIPPPPDSGATKSLPNQAVKIAYIQVFLSRTPPGPPPQPKKNQTPCPSWTLRHFLLNSLAGKQLVI